MKITAPIADPIDGNDSTLGAAGERPASLAFARRIPMHPTAPKALNALHEAFFLSGTHELHLFMVGVGLIGGTLIEQIREHAKFLKCAVQLSRAEDDEELAQAVRSARPVLSRKFAKTGKVSRAGGDLSLRSLAVTTADAVRQEE